MYDLSDPSYPSDSSDSSDSSEKNPSAAATQDKFRRVAAAVKVRKMDMEHQAADQLAFRNQSKYTTFNGFLFATVWATIDD